MCVCGGGGGGGGECLTDLRGVEMFQPGHNALPQNYSHTFSKFLI